MTRIKICGLRRPEDIGAVNGKDMTTEAAVAKLYYLFSRCLEKEQIKEEMEMDLRGELSA